MWPKTIILLFSWLSISACSHQKYIETTQIVPPLELLQDQNFKGFEAVNIESEQEVFRIDSEMREMVRKKLVPIKGSRERTKKLIEHLFANDNIDLAYQSGANLTATQAYHSQQANCLSLTIMAYALANAANLDIEFQRVEIPEYWVRYGQYNLLTGHVNLLIKGTKSKDNTVIWNRNSLTIDFDPYVNKSAFPTQKVSKALILSMFYTNKGAVAMIDGDYKEAYAYFRRAIDVEPKFVSAWSNLGILYRKKGDLVLSERAYQFALALEPNNLMVLDNMVLLMKKKGLIEQAKLLEAKIHAQRIKNPYYHALLANEAHYAGHYNEALKHIKKAIELDENVHEFYYSIAKIYYAQGHSIQALRAMKKAIRLNKTNSTERQYVAKLNWMSAKLHD